MKWKIKHVWNHQPVVWSKWSESKAWHLWGASKTAIPKCWSMSGWVLLISSPMEKKWPIELSLQQSQVLFWWFKYQRLLLKPWFWSMVYIPPTRILYIYIYELWWILNISIYIYMNIWTRILYIYIYELWWILTMMNYYIYIQYPAWWF